VSSQVLAEKALPSCAVPGNDTLSCLLSCKDRVDANIDQRSSRRGGVLQTIQDIRFPLDQFGNTGDLIKPLLRSTWRPVTAAILDHPHPGIALSVDICPVQRSDVDSLALGLSCVFVCLCVCVCVCVCVCRYLNIRMYVCIYVCMYVCIYMYIYIYISHI
jgi:hypothetical protein